MSKLKFLYTVELYIASIKCLKNIEKGLKCKGDFVYSVTSIIWTSLATMAHMGLQNSPDNWSTYLSLLFQGVSP